MSQDQDKKKVLASALRSLSASPKSRAELAGKLSQKGFAGGLICEVLNDLERNGLLNDKALAREMSSRYLGLKLSGRKKLSFELKRRGISEAIQQEVLDSISEEDEIQTAEEAARRKWSKMSQLPPEKRRKRIADFLMRRGFHYGIARDVISKLESPQDYEG